MIRDGRKSVVDAVFIVLPGGVECRFPFIPFFAADNIVRAA